MHQNMLSRVFVKTARKKSLSPNHRRGLVDSRKKVDLQRRCSIKN